MLGGLLGNMILAVKCQNELCKELLNIEKIDNFSTIIFEDVINVVKCPICGQTTIVKVTISQKKEEKSVT